MTTRPDTTPAADPDSRIDADVAVVGGGAAGLSAATFVARYGLETTVLDGGKAAITQCAHVENYLGFPAGIAPDRLLELGRTQVETEGGQVVDERVTAVRPADSDGSEPDAFAVETTSGELIADRVVVAAAYDGEVLDPLADAVADTHADAEASDDADGSPPEPFVPTDGGRTEVPGLYVAGWMSDETVHQVAVSVGHGAQVGLALARDDMSERYWPAVGERYVDWVVHDGRYGGDGWDAHVDEWFEREMLPADGDLDQALVERAREDLKAEFLGRCVTPEERSRRDRRGQRRLLDALDDDVIGAYVAETDIDPTEPTGGRSEESTAGPAGARPEGDR
ncbi:FAD-binding protein [Halorubrum sp. Atlit-8R]|nr:MULTISPECIES: FAD-dependent oxidoreductase [unclassified Halorubrum]RLM71319.1 FAD-binding protein [Halorubrum sp. Atlit-9R]RLM72187.1 FAD-binding protein [Halorubrum sp. Atlit-9R]RLM82528.1 FAD-binding protein [Halorubrum sp. Atlit-8R]